MGSRADVSPGNVLCPLDIILEIIRSVQRHEDNSSEEIVESPVETQISVIAVVCVLKLHVLRTKLQEKEESLLSLSD